jgi:hypothetical protein
MPHDLRPRNVPLAFECWSHLESSARMLARISLGTWRPLHATVTTSNITVGRIRPTITTFVPPGTVRP